MVSNYQWKIYSFNINIEANEIILVYVHIEGFPAPVNDVGLLCLSCTVDLALSKSKTMQNVR